MKKTIYILTILLLSTVLVIGCGRSEKYGTSQGITEVTGLKSIFTSPEKYEGKTVKVEGKIIEECPTGCWFNLANDEGVIYVDITPAEFAIPQKVGSKASVEGRVARKEDKVFILGESVEIR